MLLALAVGSLIALPTSGFVVSKIGAARTVAGGSVLVALGLTLAGVGADTAGVVAVVAAGLVLFGYGSGSWDVAMNVEGAAVERLLGRTIMPRFHAAFSLGTVTGAGLSAGIAAVGVPVVAHLATVSTIAMIVTIIATRSFLPHAAEVEDEDGTPVEKISVLTAWREPRTLLIGLMVMCAALVEGIANDWLALGLVDGYEVSNTVGAIGFAIFLSAMTIAAWPAPSWSTGSAGCRSCASARCWPPAACCSWCSAGRCGSRWPAASSGASAPRWASRSA